MAVIAESLLRLWNKEACDFLFFHPVFLGLSLIRGLLQLPLSVLLYITPLLSEVIGKLCLPSTEFWEINRCQLGCLFRRLERKVKRGKDRAMVAALHLSQDLTRRQLCLHVKRSEYVVNPGPIIRGPAAFFSVPAGEHLTNFRVEKSERVHKLVTWQIEASSPLTVIVYLFPLHIGSP